MSTPAISAPDLFVSDRRTLDSSSFRSAVMPNTVLASISFRRRATAAFSTGFVDSASSDSSTVGTGMSTLPSLSGCTFPPPFTVTLLTPLPNSRHCAVSFQPSSVAPMNW